MKRECTYVTDKAFKMVTKYKWSPTYAISISAVPYLLYFFI